MVRLHFNPREGPGGRITLFATLVAIAIIQATQAAPLDASGRNVDDTGLRNAHPLPRSLAQQRSVDAPRSHQQKQQQYGRGVLHNADRRSDAPEDIKQIKRHPQAAARQGIITSGPATVATTEEEDPEVEAPAAAVAATSAVPAATAVRAATPASSSSSSAPSSSAPSQSSSSATPSSSQSSSKSSASSSSSSSASPTSTSDHTGFTLTDTDNKLFPLWIVVLVAGIFGGLFVVLCGARWCFFRPHGKQDPDAFLTGYGDAAAAGRGRSIRSGAKSLRKALTKRKLAGSSFARRKEQGSVLLEVGDEVFAVPPSVAEEYQAAKKMFGGGSSNGGHSTPGVSSAGGNPFSWNGKAYLAQCLTRYEADKKRTAAAANSGRSGTAGMNIDAWTRSTSTLVTDQDEKAGGGRNQAYGVKGYGDNGEDDDDKRPKRGLSGRLAAGLRSAIRGGGREDDDDELGDPEKTTDLSTFLPVISRNGGGGERVSQGSAKNGWQIAPRADESDNQANRRAAPTPIAKDTPMISGHQVPRKPVGAAGPPRPSPAVLQKSSAQQTRMQPRGIALEDGQGAGEDGRDRIVTRRFPHDPVLLNGPGPNGQQRSGTVKKVRVNSTAEAIGTPIWEQNARSKAELGRSDHRAVSSPQFQPGQMIAHGTVPQQQHSQQQQAGPGRDRLREARAASGSGPKRWSTQSQQVGNHQPSQRSQRSNTMRVSPQHQARRGGGEEVRLDRGA